jgi:DNA polymerase
VVYWGLDDGGYLGWQNMYGGKWAAMSTQASMRDVMAAGMLNANADGSPLIMTVHDELVDEVPEDAPDHHHLCDLMCDLPSWCEGLPVKAEGFTGQFYRK